MSYLRQYLSLVDSALNSCHELHEFGENTYRGIIADLEVAYGPRIDSLRRQLPNPDPYPFDDLTRLQLEYIGDFWARAGRTVNAQWADKAAEIVNRGAELKRLQPLAHREAALSNLAPTERIGEVLEGARAAALALQQWKPRANPERSFDERLQLGAVNNAIDEKCIDEWSAASEAYAKYRGDVAYLADLCLPANVELAGVVMHGNMAAPSASSSENGELNPTSAADSTWHANLLHSIRRLRSAFEHPIPYEGRPGKTRVTMSENDEEAIRKAIWFAARRMPDALPLGVEPKLLELLDDFGNLFCREVEEPNRNHRFRLNTIREIEYALAASAIPMIHQLPSGIAAKDSREPVKCGRPKIDPETLKGQVYGKIRQLKKPRIGPKSILKLVKDKPEQAALRDQIKDLGARLDYDFIRAALRSTNHKTD